MKPYPFKVPGDEAHVATKGGNIMGATSRRGGQRMTARYSYTTWTARHLARLPTLATGQADDLKVDTGTERVWLSRCTMDDGEPCDNKVTVERLEGGRWVEVEFYHGGDK